MKEYMIKQSTDGAHKTMIIIDRETGDEIAEYRISGDSDIRAMRRVLDEHLMSGGTLGNYQF